MEALNKESCQTIFYGVNYVVASEWPSQPVQRAEFQKVLAENQVSFDQTVAGVRNFTLIRKEQSPLQVKIASLGPQVSNVGINSQYPSYTADMFLKDADTVLDVYRRTLLREPCQILQSGATVHQLYSCSDHAFKYLWEQRLNQDPQDFSHLGKPVLGGGLRLVMPPIKGDVEPVQIELKIESFLREPNKMYIEIMFVWPQPRLLRPEQKFDPEFRLKKVEKYAIREVWEFLTKSDSAS